MFKVYATSDGGTAATPAAAAAQECKAQGHKSAQTLRAALFLTIIALP